MTKISQPRQLLALEQAAARQRDAIVRHANRTVLILRDARGLKENQIRNVVNVAGTIESIEGLLNFIRYQIARERSWQAKRDPKGLDFGHQVIEDIRTAVHEAACAAADAAAARLGDADRDALYEEAYLRLAEEYLGYLNRGFVYCEKFENGGGYARMEAYVQAMRECKHDT